MKSKKHFFFLRQKNKMDFLLLILILLLTFFGLLMIYNASSVSAMNDFGDKFYYFKEQLKWFLIGFVGLTITSVIDYRYWYKLALPLLLLTLFFLIAVFIPGLGVSAYGAKRWLNLGFFVFQPAELTKITLIIYLAAWLSNKEKGRFLAFVALIMITVGLVFLEPDLGTAVIITAIALIIYFLSGASFLHFIVLLPLIGILLFISAIIAPYRLKRLITFLDPNHDPLGASYHIRQVILALGSGGWLGLGLGKSRQKYAYLPETTTDSIFAVIGEELGFVGSLFFILFYLFIIYRCFKISKSAPDKFGYLLGMGITFWLGLQFLLNLSSMTALLPLTGVPLPFISYGGSGLVVAFLALGIILNISQHRLIKK